MPTGVQRCHRCGGNLYQDDPLNKKSDIWCLQCGEWIPPLNFKPLPYVVPKDEKYSEQQWYIDQNGDIIDHIDQKIEQLLNNTIDRIHTVSSVARKVGCANSEARMTLERLVRNRVIEKVFYGASNKWTGYKKL